MKDLAADHGLIPESDVMHLRGIAKRTLSNERSQGGGPPFVRLGKKVYYPLDGLRDYIAKNTVTPSSAPTLISPRKPWRPKTAT